MSIGLKQIGYILSVLYITSSLFCSAYAQEKTTKFHATGLTKPQRIIGSTSRVNYENLPCAVEVDFDQLPVRIEFRLPSYPTLISENGLTYCNNYTETYQPEIVEEDDTNRSFEIMQDWENRYARMWIEKQSSARIVVRTRGALCDKTYRIAHTDIPSGSPYGKGDWADEWYYIYPDGIHVRHAKIYTGLAMDARPFGFDRWLPDVVYEFQESNPMPVGASEFRLDEAVDINALTLIKMDGSAKTISYDPYPENYGEFMDANIMVVNLKSQYKPFTIALAEGVVLRPQPASARRPGSTFGYCLGHIVNYIYFKQTKNTLEQVYLQGWTKDAESAAKLVPLAKSWLNATDLKIISGVKEDFSVPFEYDGYDQTQRAFLLTCEADKSANTRKLEFKITASEKSPLVNPAFVIKNFASAEIELKINNQKIEQGKDFRYGYEDENLVIWIKYETKEPIILSLSPVL